MQPLLTYTPSHRQHSASIEALDLSNQLLIAISQVLPQTQPMLCHSPLLVRILSLEHPLLRLVSFFWQPLNV